MINNPIKLIYTTAKCKTSKEEKIPAQKACILHKTSGTNFNEMMNATLG